MPKMRITRTNDETMYRPNGGRFLYLCIIRISLRLRRGGFFRFSGKRGSVGYRGRRRIGHGVANRSGAGRDIQNARNNVRGTHNLRIVIGSARNGHGDRCRTRRRRRDYGRDYRGAFSPQEAGPRLVPLGLGLETAERRLPH